MIFEIASMIFERRLPLVGIKFRSIINKKVNFMKMPVWTCTYEIEAESAGIALAANNIPYEIGDAGVVNANAF